MSNVKLLDPSFGGSVGNDDGEWRVGGDVVVGVVSGTDQIDEGTTEDVDRESTWERGGGRTRGRR